MPRIVPPLTNTQIDRAKPTEKEYNLADGNGLYLRVKPTDAKAWIFNYISPATKKRTSLTLGTFPALTLAQARAKREEYRALLEQGIDPQTHLAQQAHAEKMQNLNTFQAVAESWKAKKLGEIEEKTVRKYWRSLEKHVLPFIGKYPIPEIMPPLVIPVLQKVEAKGALDMVGRLCGYINEILNFAVNGGLIPFNPCLKMGKTFQQHTKQNNPRIKSEELPQLMQDIANARIEPQTRALIKFEMLTMVRPQEASGAKWEEIDLAAKLWTIPAERMKMREPHIVPLSTQVIRILEELQRMASGSPYIFPKWGKNSIKGENAEPMSEQTVNNALKRMGYAGRQTAHGLRGLAVTYLAEIGVSDTYADACLAHATGNQVSRAYNHSTYLEQRKAIMQQWADYVEKCSIASTL